jgi:uncharacterized protein (TIGR03435 family)
MPKFLLSLLVATALVFAQAAPDLSGSWQGTLTPPNGKELRIVVKVTKEAGAMKAVLYSIDQPAPPIPASAITLQSNTVKFTVPGIGGSYEGQLNSDANVMDGKFTQGPVPLPLVLKLATAQTAWAIPEAAAPPKPMAADANAVFEVATVKPSRPDAPQGQSFIVRGRQLITANTPLSFLIAFVYGLHPQQISGGPAWLGSDRFDIAATFEAEGIPNEKQLKTMVQKLLADRFQLKFHMDKKEMSVYTIVQGKTGPKLTASTGDPNGLPGLGFRGLGKLFTRNANIKDLASLLQTNVLDRPVLDQTGLTARYDFTLDWTPDEFQFNGRGASAPPPAAGADVPPDIFTAFQNQLGLKLEGTKAAADLFVIEKAEKPSEN